MERKMDKNIETSIRNIGDIEKRSKIYVIGIPLGKEREKWAETIFEKQWSIIFQN